MSAASNLPGSSASTEDAGRVAPEEIARSLVRASVGFVVSAAVLVVCMIVVCMIGIAAL